jgi:AI-2 transport protein TqsA
MNTLFPKIFSLITDLDLEDWKMVIVILAILLPLSVQLLIGNVIEPKVMGDTLGLHPVVLLMALVFWGVLWGLPGVLLAAPMTAIAKIVFERIEVTRPLAHVMEGRLETLDDM